MTDAGQGAEGDIPQTTIALTLEGTRAPCHPAQPVLLPPKIPECHNPTSSTTSTLTPHHPHLTTAPRTPSRRSIPLPAGVPGSC